VIAWTTGLVVGLILGYVIGASLTKASASLGFIVRDLPTEWERASFNERVDELTRSVMAENERAREANRRLFDE